MSRRALVFLGIVAIAVVVGSVVAKGRANRRNQGAQILDRYVQVTGGQQAYESVRTVVVRGTGTLMGQPVNLVEYRSAPDRFHSIISNDSTTHVQTTDGRVAWTIVDGRPDVLVGDRRADFLREAAIDRDVHWRDYFKFAECEGTTDFGGRKCHKVIVTPRLGSPETRYYDIQTSYLVGKESTVTIPNAAPQTLVQTYDNYSQYGGILMPTRQTAQLGSMGITAAVGQVQVNGQVPEELFQQPTVVKILLTAMPGYLRNAAGEP